MSVYVSHMIVSGCVSGLVSLTCVCQTESPESQVRGGVGDAAQAVLYGVDGLMHEHICHIKLLQGAEFKT